jgi:hypothetical protein
LVEGTKPSPRKITADVSAKGIMQVIENKLNSDTSGTFWDY